MSCKTKARKENRICKTSEELIKALEPSLKYLSTHFNIGGQTNKDLKQDMYLYILSHFDRFSNKGVDWWFLRLKWRLLNISKRSLLKDPLNKTISIDHIQEVYFNSKKRFNE